MKPWTDDEDKLMKKLLDEGKSFTLIANVLKRGRSSVAGRLKRLGIKSKNNPGRYVKKRKAAAPKRKTPYMRVNTKPAIKKETQPLPAPPPPPPKPVLKKPKRDRVRLPDRLRDDSYFEKYMSDPNIPAYDDFRTFPESDECRWIYGDVKLEKPVWCRAKVQPGSNYCPYHHKVVYQEKKPRTFKPGRR